MRRTVLIGVFVLGFVSFLISLAFAQDKVVVIPLFDDETQSLAPVAKTGQARCYNESGTTIKCTGTGQDGEYRKGVASPTPRFTDNGDGTVTDHLTGLIWLKNGNCFRFYFSNFTMQNNRTWQNALTSANFLSSGYCGLTDGSSEGDWRLPNYKELVSLLDLGQDNPALPSDNLIQVQYNLYWTSTTIEDARDNAWSVDFRSGVATNRAKVQSWYVLAVRGGQ
jgi:hypothetical protein